LTNVGWVVITAGFSFKKFQNQRTVGSRYLKKESKNPTVQKISETSKKAQRAVGFHERSMNLPLLQCL
jgi:pantoate kinase